MTPIVELVAEPKAEMRQTILDGMRDFNRTVLAPGLVVHDLAVALKEPETGAITGGLWGRTAWGWLAIEMIFVPDRWRKQGLATQLLALAEEEAVRRGCHAAWLDTLNPDALRLYESLGYRRFGELNDYPKGGSRFFLQKPLSP